VLLVFFGLGTLVLYGLLAFAWLYAEDKNHRRRQIIGVLAIISAAPFFIWLGAFGTMFGNNMCYSYIISDVRNELGEIVSVGNSRALAELNTGLKTLPLQGYETNCSEVRASFDALNRKQRNHAQP
jgi:hypothetical protein